MPLKPRTLTFFSHLWWFALLFGVCWFATLGYRHLITPDEGRYATLSWEILQSGDWVTPRLNGIKYFEKPILQYWISAAFFWLFGYSAFVARLYPALMGFLALFLVFFTACRIWGKELGFFSAWILGTSLWWIGNGHFLTLDMGLSAYLCGVLCGFIRAQQVDTREREARNWMLFTWAAMALAVLQKGLIGLVIPCATLVLYTLLCRDWLVWTRLHLFKGVLLFLAISAPWFILVSQHNPDFLWFFFIHEHVERFLTTTHRRIGPWWYFFPILFAGFLPWVSLLPQAIIKGFERVDGAFQTHRFLLIWAIFIFIFFSKSDSKLPSYILPLFPALAFLASHVLHRAASTSLSIPIRFQDAWASAPLIRGASVPTGNNKTNTERGEQRSQADHAVQNSTLKDDGYIGGQKTHRLNTCQLCWHLIPGLLLGIGLVIAMPIVADMGKGGGRDALYLAFSYWLGVAGIVVIAFVFAAFWFIRRQRLYLGLVMLGLTTLIGGQLASLGHNHFALTNSSWYLVQGVQTYIHPNTKLYVFRMYDQTLPFYFQRHLQFVEYRDEFDFGQRQEPDKWMDVMNFKNQWEQTKDAILITSKEAFKELENFPGKIIYEDPRRIVLRR